MLVILNKLECELYNENSFNKYTTIIEEIA